MKYNPPFGNPDPNAGYVDRNVAGAVSGSKVPASAIEMPQREIVTVITNAGLAPTNDDPTQLLQAIDLKIAAATGSEGDENYVLMTQARVRLPIFPAILTADGRIPVVSPAAGQVRVPAGYDFLHRGIFVITTVQADFATAANKTYHLRWSPSTGFALKDVGDVAYNPTAAAETSAIFDSTYDDMLVARVVTSAGNVPTITNLANRDRLSQMLVDEGVVTTLPGSNGASRASNLTWNWARQPLLQVVPASFSVGPSADEASQFAANQVHDHDFSIVKTNVSRYGASVTALRDYSRYIGIEAFISA